MKITAVEPILIHLPFQPQSRSGGRLALAGMDTLFVRVTTDAGITGWGEAFGFKLCATTKTAIETLIAPLAVNRDAGDITGVMRDLTYRMHNYGRNGPAQFGLAGLDIALWDIAGKIAGKPLYQLLGGARRHGDSIDLPAYASLWRYGDAATIRLHVEKACRRGYREIKLHEIDLAVIAAARDVAGPDIPFTLDVNCAWTVVEAIENSKRLAKLGVRWLEEPTWPPEDFSALADVNRNSVVPVAAGENITSAAQFVEMFAMKSVAFVQPSVAKVGISGMLEVAELARTHGVAFAPHSPYFGPGLIATMHLAAAIGGELAVERYYCDLEPGPLGNVIEAQDGRFRLPNGPGLSVNVDERLIARYRVG